MANLLIEKIDYRKPEHRQVIYTDLFFFMFDFYKKYYPSFKHWYFTKIIYGLENNQRSIYLVKSDTSICGVSIIRKANDLHQNKICSFILSTEIRNNGVGTQLIQKSKSELFQYSDRPILITVPEERLFEKMGKKTLGRFLTMNGFTMSKKIMGIYRPGKYEYILQCMTDPYKNDQP